MVSSSNTSPGDGFSMNAILAFNELFLRYETGNLCCQFSKPRTPFLPLWQGAAPSQDVCLTPSATSLTIVDVYHSSDRWTTGSNVARSRRKATLWKQTAVKVNVWHFPVTVLSYIIENQWIRAFDNFTIGLYVPFEFGSRNFRVPSRRFRLERPLKSDFRLRKSDESHHPRLLNKK